MKKVFFIPLVLCFISFADGDGFFEKGPFFWKAEKDGRVLHILGTVHVGVDFEDLKCSEEISQSLVQANLVWTEFGLHSNLNQSMQQTPVQNTQPNELMLDSSGDSFRNLNKESKDFFYDNVKNRREDLIDYFKSSNYLGLLHAVNQLCLIKHVRFIYEWNQKNKIESMLDVQIRKLAEDKGISQNYLDTQQGLDNLALSKIKFMRRFIEGEGFSFKETIERDIKSCTQENLEKSLEANDQVLVKVIENTLSGQDFDILELNVQNFKEQGWTENQIKKYSEFFYKNIIKERNENWLKKIASAHQEEENKSMFIAAGLAHFTGDDNVLDMLKGEGFTVKRYSAGCVAEESY